MRVLEFEVTLENGWHAGISHMDIPIVLVSFHNDRRPGENKSARLDLDKRVFIDPTPKDVGTTAAMKTAEAIYRSLRPVAAG